MMKLLGVFMAAATQLGAWTTTDVRATRDPGNSQTAGPEASIISPPPTSPDLGFDV